MQPLESSEKAALEFDGAMQCCNCLWIRIDHNRVLSGIMARVPTVPTVPPVPTAKPSPRALPRLWASAGPHDGHEPPLLTSPPPSAFGACDTTMLSPPPAASRGWTPSRAAGRPQRLGHDHAVMSTTWPSYHPYLSVGAVRKGGVLHIPQDKQAMQRFEHLPSVATRVRAESALHVRLAARAAMLLRPEPVPARSKTSRRPDQKQVAREAADFALEQVERLERVARERQQKQLQERALWNARAAELKMFNAQRSAKVEDGPGTLVPANADPQEKKSSRRAHKRERRRAAIKIQMRMRRLWTMRTTGVGSVASIIAGWKIASSRSVEGEEEGEGEEEEGRGDLTPLKKAGGDESATERAVDAVRRSVMDDLQGGFRHFQLTVAHEARRPDDFAQWPQLIGCAA